MKRIVAILCLLALTGTLCACRLELPEKKPLVEAELYVYDVFMDCEPKLAEFTLEGKFPTKKQESGDFSGHITVEETDGTKHTYKNLEYCWTEDMLILYRGNPTAEKGEGVLCWIDPKNPEEAVLADRNWCERSSAAEILAYVDDTYTDAEARSIGSVINQIPNVHKSQFIHREGALEDFADDPAFDGVDADVLRHRFVITLETGEVEEVEKTASQIEEITGVAEVQYSLWAPESIRILGYKKNGEKMAQLLEKMPELPKE